jgi:hypothetical protein
MGAPDAEVVELPDNETQGRGETAAEPKGGKSRRKRTPAGGKRTPRKLVMPDTLYRRLTLLAMDRNSDVSAVSVEILDRHVPHYEVKRLERAG